MTKGSLAVAPRITLREWTFPELDATVEKLKTSITEVAANAIQESIKELAFCYLSLADDNSLNIRLCLPLLGSDDEEPQWTFSLDDALENETEELLYPGRMENVMKLRDKFLSLAALCDLKLSEY
jgi:hypothetical protein